ncbi:synaptonemal complex protein 1-like [Halichondria panicea]|uniref:synaptonemal complex protein 1-like n=1 Tax=Halichondria panicea TaxID=6063 RepID=UPI00312BC59D
MHADLDRIRTERNELRQRAGQLEELDKKYNNSQQKIIFQQALLENKQKELDDLRRDMPPLKVAIQKHRTDLIHISKQRDEAKSELDLSKQTMQIYEDDFRSEREDREKAHSKIAEMETRYVKKLESMTNELQTKARELQAAVTTHSELKARYDAEVTQLRFDLREKNNQIHHYGQKAQKLEEDIQAKTAQVTQYEKQVDQFKNQVETRKEQAQILQAQVESIVTQTDHLVKENKKLTYENQQLIGRLRQLEDIQSQCRRLQEQLDKRLQSIDDLTMKNTMLLSELEVLKKKGVVSLENIN